VHTNVEGQALKLSNLDKLLYEHIGVTKAEIIQYVMDVAPHFLKFVKNRPLTLIRYPDGVEGKKFYSKQKPEWTPKWIGGFTMQHSEEPIDYVVVENTAGLVWLANLAALEIHPMQFQFNRPKQPDHFIFDLDPPVDGDFEGVKSIAKALNNFLRGYGYVSFIKTSGSKGLHIYVPIETEATHEKMVDVVKALAKDFVKQNSSSCTLAISKNRRGGKTFVDVLRNHEAQTAVAPYSLRAKPNASISFPILWKELDFLNASTDIHLRNYKQYLDDRGPAWSRFYESARPLHTDVDRLGEKQSILDEKLKEYNSKRDLNKTPEPQAQPIISTGNKFNIQLHHASNLHYDLRLELNGVLLSWAIPKGLPWKTGAKRLAIRTEDHPLEYLNFEGVIPKGAYGAGKIWNFCRGTFDWIEKKDGSYKFELTSDHFNRSFNLFRTKGNQWLIELIENKDFSELIMPLSPMLAASSDVVPQGSQYSFEIKWDGIRVLVYLFEDEVKVFSRNGRDISVQFPELLDANLFEVESGIFDGEIVSLDDEGKPVFSHVISRLHKKQVGSSKGNRHNVTCYLFDCIYLDGKSIASEPQYKRMDWLNVVVKWGSIYRISQRLDDGAALFEATKEMGLEGIMAKKKNAQYTLGQRSYNWLKIKHRKSDVCYIAGYTKGEGARSDFFGALHLVRDDGAQKKYMGKVGTGFDDAKMRHLLAIFESLIQSSKEFQEKTDDDSSSVWLQPVLKCEIIYASLSSNGTYREPVFVKLIED